MRLLLDTHALLWFYLDDPHLIARARAALVALPFHHKDPFDRMPIAQALVEGVSIVSVDSWFDPYPVARLW